MSGPVDVLVVLANPAGYYCDGKRLTSDIASWAVMRGQKVTVARVLTALRREERAGNVVCCGRRGDDGSWCGNNITQASEYLWRLADEYAEKHGNSACRAALANVGGAK